MFTRIQAFFRTRGNTMRKYPGASLISIVIAVSGILLNHHSGYGANQERENLFTKVLFSGILTLPLMIIGPLMRQIDDSLSKQYVIFSQGVALLLGLLFYITLPQDFTHIVGSEQLWVALTMIGARLIPFGKIVHASKYHSQTIRNRSEQVIGTFAIACLSVLIVGGGVAASMASFEYLFDTVIDGKIYRDMWLVVVPVLGTAIWLMHIHKPKEWSFNNIFRFFSLYIFLPLSVLYAVILLSYGLKILVTGTRPRGLIVRMVIGYTAFGMIGYLLSYPLRQTHTRLRKVHAGYFVSLLLFVILLFVAIGIRINQYGLTGERYLVLAVGLRIVVISGISLRKPSQSLSGIILTFLIILALSTFGPQSATNLPTTLQYNKLVKLLEQNQFLQDGHIVTRNTQIATGVTLSGDMTRIYNIAEYLAEQEGKTVFKPLYPENEFEEFSGIDTQDSRSSANQFVKSLGFSSTDIQDIQAVGEQFGDEGYFHFYGNNDQYVSIDISDYISFIRIHSYQSSPSTNTGFTVKFERADRSNIVLQTPNKTVSIDLHEHIDIIRKTALQYNKAQVGVPAWIEIDTDSYKLILTEVSGQGLSNDNYEISSFNGYVFLK